ncbi:MAG: alcohol dehydrogenase catalytic domain-containing protein [Chloroflexi bacterium]|nr:alcohol dehydrogenase catalytic domain-containing protein [Chloroflexota bacterium]
MRAAVLVAPFQLVVQDVPKPEPKPGQVLIKMLSASVCGSDVHAFQGVHPRTKPGNTWFGHELAGEVAGLGQGVSGLEIGQRVAADGVLPCGECLFCQEGQGNHCLYYRTTGSRQDGGLAEFACVPAQNVYPIPDFITMDRAALIQPLSIAYRAVRERAQVQAGQTVVVIGAGPIGLSALAHCLAVGAKVMVLEMRQGRLEMAERLGAQATLDPTREDPLGAVEAFTDGYGVNHTIECVGGEQSRTLPLACQLTRMGGTITQVGSYSTELLTLRTREFAYKELTLKSSHSYVGASAYAACVELVASNTIDMSPLVTHTFPLARAQETLTRLNEGDPEIVKAVIHPQE